MTSFVVLIKEDAGKKPDTQLFSGNPNYCNSEVVLTSKIANVIHIVPVIREL
jgi:hypothetical protein